MTDGALFRKCFSDRYVPDLLQMGFVKQSHMHYVFSRDALVLGCWIQDKSDHTSCCVNVYADYLFFVDWRGKPLTRESIVKSGSGCLRGRIGFHRGWLDPDSPTAWWKYRQRRFFVDRQASIEASCRRFSKGVIRGLSAGLSAAMDLRAWVEPLTAKQIRRDAITPGKASLSFSGNEIGRAYFLAQAHRHLGNAVRAREMIRLCSKLHESNTELKDWEKKPLRAQIAAFEENC